MTISRGTAQGILHLRFVTRVRCITGCFRRRKSIDIAMSQTWYWKMRGHSVKDLGYTDRQKFAEYLESIRTIETQMDRLETMRAGLSKVDFKEPTDSHMPRGEYIRLMGDLMVVALQTGLTNVATFMIGPERWDTPFMFESLFDKPRSHHGMSHNQTKMLDDLLKVDRFHHGAVRPVLSRR